MVATRRSHSAGDNRRGRYDDRLCRGRSSAAACRCAAPALDAAHEPVDVVVKPAGLDIRLVVLMVRVYEYTDECVPGKFGTSAEFPGDRPLPLPLRGVDVDLQLGGGRDDLEDDVVVLKSCRQSRAASRSSRGMRTFPSCTGAGSAIPATISDNWEYGAEGMRGREFSLVVVSGRACPASGNCLPAARAATDAPGSRLTSGASRRSRRTGPVVSQGLVGRVGEGARSR